MDVTEKTYEMMWDCEYCGQKKLLGLSQRFCPQCGAPQNAQKRYFPPENEKVAVQDHQFVGADVNCPACKQPMSKSCNACTNCGSPIDAGKQVAMQQMQVQGQGGQWQAAPAAGQAPTEKKSKLPLILGLAALALVGTCVVMYNMKRDASMVVARHEWTREIPIERYDEVDKHGDCSGVPGGARIKSRNQPAKKCTKKKIDSGDGTFKEREECTTPPEQCDYTVDEWRTIRTAKASGGLDKAPTWPDINVRGCTFAARGCEREGKRSEKYSVYFSEDGGKKKEDLSCDFNNADNWKKYEDGSKYKGKVRMLGGLDCDSLQKL